MITNLGDNVTSRLIVKLIDSISILFDNPKIPKIHNIFRFDMMTLSNQTLLSESSMQKLTNKSIFDDIIICHNKSMIKHIVINERQKQ